MGEIVEERVTEVKYCRGENSTKFLFFWWEAGEGKWEQENLRNFLLVWNIKHHLIVMVHWGFHTDEIILVVKGNFIRMEASGYNNEDFEANKKNESS